MPSCRTAPSPAPALQNRGLDAARAGAYLRQGLAASALAALAACHMDGEITGHSADPIVGGEDIAIEEVPWQVSLQSSFGGSHFCGGSILSENWVITAAHCVDSGDSVSTTQVAAGITDQSDEGQVADVAELIIADGYGNINGGVENDFAILRLDSPLDLSGSAASAIELVTPEDREAGATEPGTPALVSGWGATSEGGDGAETLQAVEIPIMSEADAIDAYGSAVTDDQLAAGLEEGGKDACQGDSGGPLVVDVDGTPKLAGVVSWGDGCAREGSPGMYARVSAFESLVVETVGRNRCQSVMTHRGSEVSCEDDDDGDDGDDNGDDDGDGNGGSCEGACGFESADGCHCDHECEDRGDCCDDFDSICVPDGSCAGACGDQSLDDCYCDAECLDEGDCCPDIEAACL